MLQLEIPIETVEYVINIAYQKKKQLFSTLHLEKFSNQQFYKKSLILHQMKLSLEF